eukprot:scaffold3297_cov21-Tisochrysis_lutea.AAC.4
MCCCPARTCAAAGGRAHHDGSCQALPRHPDHGAGIHAGPRGGCRHTCARGHRETGGPAGGRKTGRGWGWGQGSFAVHGLTGLLALFQQEEGLAAGPPKS